VLTVAVTGGIGAGKSTVSRLLADRGAVVIDSDRLARDVVAPGTDGLAAVAREFGDGVLTADGSLDRAALAAVVFADPAARARLEGIIHPRVRAEFRRLRGEVVARDPGAVVVNDIPILRSPAVAAEFDVVVVVTAEVAVRVARLADRGMTEDDARARIDAQIPDDERARLADVVIPNDGDEETLRRRVDALWQDLRSRQRAGKTARQETPSE
jgi:dephospho-CoA kinase